MKGLLDPPEKFNWFIWVFSQTLRPKGPFAFFLFTVFCLLLLLLFFPFLDFNRHSSSLRICKHTCAHVYFIFYIFACWFICLCCDVNWMSDDLSLSYRCKECFVTTTSVGRTIVKNFFFGPFSVLLFFSL